MLCSVAGGLSAAYSVPSLVHAARGLPGQLGQLLMRHPVAFAACCGLALAVLGVPVGRPDLRHRLRSGARHGRGRPPRCPRSYVVLKFAATVISYVSGIPGGLFAPSLSVGAGLGAWLAHLMPAAPGGSGRAARHGGILFRRGAGADHRGCHRDGDDRQPAGHRAVAGDGVPGIRRVAAGLPPPALYRAGTSLPRRTAASAPC